MTVTVLCWELLPGAEAISWFYFGHDSFAPQAVSRRIGRLPLDRFTLLSPFLFLPLSPRVSSFVSHCLLQCLSVLCLPVSPFPFPFFRCLPLVRRDLAALCLFVLANMPSFVAICPFLSAIVSLNVVLCFALCALVSLQIASNVSLCLPLSPFVCAAKSAGPPRLDGFLPLCLSLPCVPAGPGYSRLNLSLSPLYPFMRTSRLDNLDKRLGSSKPPNLRPLPRLARGQGSGRPRCTGPRSLRTRRATDPPPAECGTRARALPRHRRRRS